MYGNIDASREKQILYMSEHIPGVRCEKLKDFVSAIIGIVSTQVTYIFIILFGIENTSSHHTQVD